jgi:internalin A
MRSGDLISAFIQRLTHADLVVAVISDKYLRSSYCMFEIYKLWQRCQGDAKFLADCVVPIMLPEVKVGNLRDRAPYLEYWAEQADSLEALILKLGLSAGGQSWEGVRLVREFAHHVDDILVFLQDVLIPRKLAVQFDDGFRRSGRLCSGGWAWNRRVLCTPLKLEHLADSTQQSWNVVPDGSPEDVKIQGEVGMSDEVT